MSPDSELAAVLDVLTAWTPRISEQIAQLYRDLHRHPELSMQEHHTAAAVVAALEPLGLDVTAGWRSRGVAQRGWTGSHVARRYGRAAGR